MVADARRIVLTGASRGLGRAIAVALGQRGHEVALVARDAEALDLVAREVAEAGGLAHVVPTDLADEAAVDGLAARLREVMSGVDIVIHNAGVDPFAPFAALPPAAVRRAIAVNLVSPMLLTQALVGDLMATRGQVLFMGSTSGMFVAPWAAAYGASKAGIASLARSLAVELADDGIAVSVIQPGFVVDTGMFVDHVGDRALAPPPWLGSTTSSKVVAAVLRTIETREPARVINSAPVAGMVALAQLLPAFGLRLARPLVAPFMRRLALR